MGAKIIEKHVYLKGKNFGPDRDVSISFDQLKEMVTAIRTIEQSFGEKKIIHHKEKEIVKWAKRSLVSLKDLEKGKVIQLGDIWSKRPFTGIPSKYYYKILGKKLKKNIPKNTILKYSDINQ